MSVRQAKSGKTSHHQKPVRAAAGGLLFAKALKGHPRPVRGAAGGLLFLKARTSKTAKTKTLKRPSFEHSARGGRLR